MRLSRLKLLAIMALFALPIVASTIAYHFFPPGATANYGELIVPPQAITTSSFRRVGGGEFAFGELRGKWVLMASDSGTCPASCDAKLLLMRQLRLMLGRNAHRLSRVFVADDTYPIAPRALAPYEGTVVIISHDRYFLDRTVERLLVIENGQLVEYQGGYSDYLEKKK